MDWLIGATRDMQSTPAEIPVNFKDRAGPTKGIRDAGSGIGYPGLRSRQCCVWGDLRKKRTQQGQDWYRALVVVLSPWQGGTCIEQVRLC